MIDRNQTEAKPAKMLAAVMRTVLEAHGQRHVCPPVTGRAKVKTA